MSRSYNNNGYKGIANSGVAKHWKKKTNRKFRKREKREILSENIPLDLNEVSNPYDCPKDKVYFKYLDWLKHFVLN